jgi:type I restriction enzyme, S subunit
LKNGVKKKIMHKELPKGWVETKLGIIAEWGSGGTPNRNESKYYKGSIPWIKTGDLNDSIILEASEYITELGLQKSSAKIFPIGAIIIAMYGATIGKTAVLGIDASTNQACGVAKVSKIVLPEFLHYYLKSEKQNFIEKGKGGAQPNISQTVIKEHPFPLPPLPTQHRIVSKLDTLFGHLDALKTRLDRIPQLLKTFRQSVLTQAVTGNAEDYIELGDYEIDIQTGPFGSALHKEDYIVNGIPVINPSHIIDGKIIPDNEVAVSTNKLKELSRWILEDGDVILGRRGEMGRAAVYTEKDQKMICGTGSLVLKKSNRMDSNFLLHYLRCPFTISFLETNSVGSTMVNLNQKIVRSIPIPNLDIKEQQQRIEMIESLFAKADRIEAQYQNLKAKIEQLPQALLAKAFRGELVEQLPGDGDARELLEEIKKLKGETGERKKETGKKKIYQVPDKELNIAAEP